MLPHRGHRSQVKKSSIRASGCKVALKWPFAYHEAPPRDNAADTAMKKFSGLAAVCAITAVFTAFFTGCESADSHSISVSPGHARLQPGQSVTLVASGWNDYSWTIDSAGVGHLSRSTGSSVVFTAESGVSNATVTVTATAVGSGGSSSTNGTSSASSSGGYTADARIEIGQ